MKVLRGTLLLGIPQVWAGGGAGTWVTGKLIFSNLCFFFSFLFSLSTISAKSNTPLEFGLWWLQVEGCVPLGPAASAARPASAVAAGPRLHAPARLNEPAPLFAPSVINCLRLGGLCCVQLISSLSPFFSPSNFTLIDSICFHLLCIDLFVLLCLVNQRNL